MLTDTPHPGVRLSYPFMAGTSPLGDSGRDPGVFERAHAVRALQDWSE